MPWGCLRGRRGVLVTCSLLVVLEGRASRTLCDSERGPGHHGVGGECSARPLTRRRHRRHPPRIQGGPALTFWQSVQWHSAVVAGSPIPRLPRQSWPAPRQAVGFQPAHTRELKLDMIARTAALCHLCRHCRSCRLSVGVSVRLFRPRLSGREDATATVTHDRLEGNPPFYI